MNERDRLVKIMECEGLNAKQFSAEVGISNGTTSNILGGRNKPSLEVMQAILHRFRSISCQWLIMGTGSMYLTPTTQAESSEPTLFPEGQAEQGQMEQGQWTKDNGARTMEQGQRSKDDGTRTMESGQRRIQKILIFYSDGTFEER